MVGPMMIMRLLVILIVAFGCASPALAQQDRVPPVATYKMMADANKASGWVAFRNYDGKQLIYFTPLVTLHCGISEIAYSINSPALNEIFPLPACHPALPFSLPPDAGLEAIALSLPLSSAERVAVQITYNDGSQSGILVFEPCVAVGDATCAFLVE